MAEGGHVLYNNLWLKKDAKKMLDKVGHNGDAVTEIQCVHPVLQALKAPLL